MAYSFDLNKISIIKPVSEFDEAQLKTLNLTLFARGDHRVRDPRNAEEIEIDLRDASDLDVLRAEDALESLKWPPQAYDLSVFKAKDSRDVYFKKGVIAYQAAGLTGAAAFLATTIAVTDVAQKKPTLTNDQENTLASVAVSATLITMLLIKMTRDNFASLKTVNDYLPALEETAQDTRAKQLKIIAQRKDEITQQKASGSLRPDPAI